MARFTPTIAGEIRGSIGAITFATNRGGAYMRLRVIPVNPNTPAQSLLRTLLADLGTQWVDQLTQAQRDGWNQYDENLPGPFGNRGGIAQFTRSNTVRGYADFPTGGAAYTLLPFVADAPVIFDQGGFTPVGMIVSAAGSLLINIDNTDQWANEDDAAMLVYMSPSQNASITNYSRRMNLVGIIPGDSITPPTSTFPFATLPFPVVENGRIFIRVSVSRNDGRYSASQFLNAIAIA